MLEPPIDDWTLLRQVNAAKESFGVLCSKYSGAITVEWVRHALEQQSIPVSPRDVFIAGVPVEIDLLVPRREAVPRQGVLYQPEDVLVALEIKNHGSFGLNTIEHTRDCFKRIREKNGQIWCAYVTLAERKGYRWAVTDANLGSPSFTLFWHDGSTKAPRYYATGDWDRLLGEISDRVR